VVASGFEAGGHRGNFGQFLTQERPLYQQRLVVGLLALKQIEFRFRATEKRPES
jgi:hypothetical protein